MKGTNSEEKIELLSAENTYINWIDTRAVRSKLLKGSDRLMFQGWNDVRWGGEEYGSKTSDLRIKLYLQRRQWLQKKRGTIWAPQKFDYIT